MSGSLHRHDEEIVDVNAASRSRDAPVYAKNAAMAAVSSENAQRSAILPSRT